MSSDGPSKVGHSLSIPDADAPRPEPLDELILNDDEPIELPPAVGKASSPPSQRGHGGLPLPTPPSPRASRHPHDSVVDAQEAPRARAKMTLRIPDDEVARPEPLRVTPDGGIAAVQSRPPPPRSDSAPPSRNRMLAAAAVPDFDDVPIVPASDPAILVTAASEAEEVTGPAAGIDASSEPGWTPFQPPVDHVSSGRRASGSVAAKVANTVVTNGAVPEARGTLLDRFEVQNAGPPSSEEIPIDMDLSSVASAPDTMQDPTGAATRQPSSLDSDDLRVDESDRVTVDASDDDEVSAEDLVSIESLSPGKNPSGTMAAVKVASPESPRTAVAATRPASATPSQPPVAPPAASSGGQALRRSGSSLVFVPPASALAPPPMTDSAAARKKTRPWWEELFNDDFIRTMAKVSDSQIASEVTFIEESLGCEAGAMVLDLACGTGRHAVELAVRGYQVVGFDLSLSMLARASDEAQDRKQKINFVQGDMREMTFDETFDGIYSWNTSFGYFDEEKNGAVIARVHKALKKGGQFLLDVVNRDYVVQQAPSLAWFEGDGCICMDEMTIDFITSRMKVKRTLMMDDGRTKEIEYSIRAYSLHELGKMLHDNGFRVAEVSGRTGTPGVFFGCESPRTLILAEKR